MADEATERTTIEAPLARCFEVTTDFERYPEWARDVKQAEVVERDPDGRPLRVAFRAGAMGHSASYTLRYDWSESPRRLTWVLERGDILRRLDGFYEFEPATDGAEATQVTYHVAVELAVPLPGFVKRRAEGRIVATALEELKRRVEAVAA